MNRSLQIKIVLIVVLTLWSLYSLWPTVQLAQGIDDKSVEQQDKIKDKAIKRGLDLSGGMYLVLEVDSSQLDGVTETEAMDRTLEILRNRVDQFGVSEPDIRKEGGTRIVVQLPGLQDAERAKRLIGSTARLDFRMVKEGSDATSVVSRLDRALSGVDLEQALADSASAAAATEGGADIDSLLSSGEVEDLLGADFNPDRPFSGLLGPFLPNRGAFPVSDSNRRLVSQLLARPEVARVLPRDVEFLWGAETLPAQGGGLAYLLYLVDKKVELAGNEISNAVVTADPDRPPQLMVSLTLTRRGGLRFANVTGANVDRKLGIVVDNVVQSAPVIRQKISGGRASISGGFENDNEARDLALMLRAGALPADVRVEEERTVGPSLGRDSIRQGMRSVVIGLVIVVLFMMVYYRLAGILATLGLVMTMLLLMGILAQLHLTLTLPGIAGIILTVGMAVDANVLIFERIREELRNGKTVRASIDAGYSQAMRAIVDANITTFIAALVLFYFGTGPIKGFAVTLSIGILTSMFSALVFTRTVYQIWLRDRAPKSLSV